MLAGGQPCVVLAFGSPYLISSFSSAKTWIGEFSTNDVSQRAAVRALFGQTAIEGRIPVTVPETVKRGDGLRVAANPMTLEPASQAVSSRLAPAYALLDRAVDDGAFPGGVLTVGLNDQLVVHPFGKFTRNAKAAPVRADTIYDLASLTKPIVTTTSVMILAQQKRLDIDAPLSRFLPEWSYGAKNDPNPVWRARVTPRMLLLHDSGLPAHRDFYRDAKGHDAILARVFAEPLVHEPGTQIEYSDLGFILLGEIVERLTGTSLAEFAQKEIFAPLGMNNSLFNPPRSLRARIPPTENDQTYRKRMIQGEVHDQNAWAMGGIAGDAGMFSTAGDVAIFAQMILNGGIYAHHRVVSRAMVAEFTAHQTVGNSARALGWDVALDPGATGRFFSPHAFGHYGFTGTSLWIDPDHNLFIILLTNRVNPSVDNIKIRRVRPELHDAIFEALGLASTPMAVR
jgi:CubicO group peptidase (beta-lactamase class C family)